MKLYFTLKELNPHNYTLTPEIEANLNILINKVSVIREAYGKSLVVTSGLRSQADQARINPKAPKSAHLEGKAVDISDVNGDFNKFLKNNTKLLEDNGLYCEERQGPWQHLQTRQPKSKKRWFLP